MPAQRRPRRRPPPQGGFAEVSLAEMQAALPETPFQRNTVDVAHACGWRVLWLRPVRIEDKTTGRVRYETPFGGDGVGYVDLTLVREVVLHIELKSASGSLRPEQKEWRDALIAAGQHWAEYRPAQRRELDRILSHRWIRGSPPEMVKCADRWCCS